MPTTIQLRRGTTAQHNSFTGSVGEITVDTDLNTVRVHDGSTVGGTRLVVYNEVTDRLQVANANITFETKAVALAANTAQNSLINDRLQVANANITFETKAVALAANTAQNNLINDRLQVANAAAIYATKAYAAANTYVNAQIGASNTNIRNYTDTTYETKAVALTSNNAQNSLILDRLQVANANITFETKAVALSANNAQNSLILDRLQVANAASLFVNVTGDTMSGALAMGSNKITGLGTPTAGTDATTKTYVDTQVAGVVDSAPETLNTLNELAAALGDDANFAATTATTLGTKAANTYVNATFATKAYAAANTYVNAQIGTSNTNIRAFANQTYETKAVALAANTAQNSLINDRLQVANANITFETKAVALAANTAQNSLILDRIQVANSRVEFLQSANTTVTSGAGSITTTMNQVDLNDEALVNPAGFLTINIGGTNYKLPFYS